jgi:hypothetical protein
MAKHRKAPFGAIAPARRLVCIAAASCLTLAACAGPAYHARGPEDAIGYTDARLSPIRFRVSYTGDRATARTAVENFVLRRAAELTLAAGYPYFVIDSRATHANTYNRLVFEPVSTDPGPAPTSHGNSWLTSRPFSPVTANTLSSTSYTATSEIVLLRTDQADGNPNALSAQEIIRRLGAGGSSAAEAVPGTRPPA